MTPTSKNENNEPKKKRLKRLRTIVALTFALLFCLTLYIHLMNNNLRNIENSRDTRLDSYSETTTWVMQDIRAYLEIHNNATLQSVLSSSHMTSSLMQTMFPSKTYNASYYPHYTKVSFVDSQYTFKQNGTFEVYLLANVYHGSKSRQMNIIAFINGNRIYNVVAY